MNPGTVEDPPPPSDDLGGWRQAIADERLDNFRLESVASAFQDLGARDKNVQNALAKHLSKAVLKLLRKYVGVNHPNRGEDIILRVHGAIFVALLSPESADGRNLRVAFVPRVLFRMKDAIAIEARERRIPDPTTLPDEPKRKKPSSAGQAVAVQTAESSEKPPIVEDGDGNDGEVASQNAHDSFLFDSVNETNEQVEVGRILECVPDDRKRLAFWLFMNDVPYKSKRKDVTSIATAVGVSEKTARDWIKEVQQLLARNETVKHLKKLRAGDRI